jgi:hypothetical protein
MQTSGTLTGKRNTKSLILLITQVFLSDERITGLLVEWEDF